MSVCELCHRDSLWRILQAYWIPSHLIKITRRFYHNFTCSAVDGDILFEVKTGVRQGCLMSTVLFNLVVDWITGSCCALQRIRTGASHGLPSLIRKSRLCRLAKQVCLNISSKKTEVTALNTTNRGPVRVENGDLPYMDRFTFLGSIISSEGRAAWTSRAVSTRPEPLLT